MTIPQWLFDEANKEHDFAIKRFPEFASAHEGLAIIEEEFEELKREVFVNQSKRDNGKLQKEALQLATMSLCFIIDVCCNNKGGLNAKN
jgi:hypothetical protein